MLGSYIAPGSYQAQSQLFKLYPGSRISQLETSLAVGWNFWGQLGEAYRTFDLTAKFTSGHWLINYKSFFKKNLAWQPFPHSEEKQVRKKKKKIPGLSLKK